VAERSSTDLPWQVRYVRWFWLRQAAWTLQMLPQTDDPKSLRELAAKEYEYARNIRERFIRDGELPLVTVPEADARQKMQRSPAAAARAMHSEGQYT